MTTHKKFAAQSESLKCSLLEKEPFTDMIDVGPHMDRPNQHEVPQVFSDKISHVWTITCICGMCSHKTSYAKVLQLPGSTIRPLCRKCPYLCKFTSNYTKPHEIFKFEFSTWMWLHLLSPTSSWWFYIEFSIFYEFYSFSVIFHRKKINKHLPFMAKRGNIRLRQRESKRGTIRLRQRESIRAKASPRTASSSPLP